MSASTPKVKTYRGKYVLRNSWRENKLVLTWYLAKVSQHTDGRDHNFDHFIMERNPFWIRILFLQLKEYKTDPYISLINVFCTNCKNNVVFDLIWFDLIWFDLTWHELIWFDLFWFDLIWFDMIWFSELADQFQVWNPYKKFKSTNIWLSNFHEILIKHSYNYDIISIWVNYLLGKEQKILDKN